MLERWARNYALYRKLAKAVDHDGTTITVLKADGSTELKPASEREEPVRGAGRPCRVRTGTRVLRPASRARVSPPPKEEEEKDDFDGF